MTVQKFYPGDKLIMKKKHPCSSDRFSVIRIGSDVRVKCELCSREITLPREKLEKSIKQILHQDNT